MYLCNNAAIGALIIHNKITQFSTPKGEHMDSHVKCDLLVMFLRSTLDLPSIIETIESL